MAEKAIQYELAFVNREVDNNPIQQRIMDGYINATALCKAVNKNLADFARLKTTNEFLKELSFDMGIPISVLIQVVRGGNPQLQGTWVHPQVAINLAQWASPKFAVAVSKWVFEWMNGNIPNSKNLPYHLQRYLINRTQIPPTHFSIFNEIVYNLIAPLEDKGYELPDKLVPDISEGRMFARWVRDEKGLEPNDFPTYTHTYPDGRSIPNVKLYPNSLLGDFRDHFYNVWIREKATKYFKERDTNALPYLEKVVAELPPVQQFKQIENQFDQNLTKALNYNPKDKEPSN